MNEIETIFCKLLKCDRASLYLDEHKTALKPEQYRRLEQLLARRVQGEPLQYLLGEAVFMGLTFQVEPGILVPRPETEILVETVLSALVRCAGKPCRVLDIGTGSGNIIVSLAHLTKHTDCSFTATDISPACLIAARANARRHHAEKKISFVRSDVWDAFSASDVFDLVVSNPPYVTADEYEHLPPDVTREPRLALVADHDGLSFYEKIEEGARRHLVPGGSLFLEIGCAQGPAIKKIFSSGDIWRDFAIIKDYNQRDRVVVVTKV
jgi:release factor glutamine methyltransferase